MFSREVRAFVRSPSPSPRLIRGLIPLAAQGASAIVLVDHGTDAKDMHIVHYLGFLAVDYLHINQQHLLPNFIWSAIAAAAALVVDPSPGTAPSPTSHRSSHTDGQGAVNASACQAETSGGASRFVRVDRDTMHAQAQSCAATHIDFTVEFNASIASWVDLKQIQLVVSVMHCSDKLQVTPTVHVEKSSEAASPSFSPQFGSVTFQASVHLNTSACARPASIPHLNEFVDVDFALAAYTPCPTSSQSLSVESQPWRHVFECPAASAKMHELSLLQSHSIKKVRRGNSEPDETGFDGGYIVMMLPDDNSRSYDLILSAGIADDVSFEEEMAVLYDAPVHLYDGTIEEYPSSQPPPNVFFHRQNISADADEGCSLSEWFLEHNDIFLKMDIEGHEFSWLASLSTADLLKIKQIIIEIHLSDSLVQLQQRQRPVLSRLASTHALLHAHGNNCKNQPWLQDQLCPRGDV